MCVILLLQRKKTKEKEQIYEEKKYEMTRQNAMKCVLFFFVGGRSSSSCAKNLTVSVASVLDVILIANAIRLLLYLIFYIHFIFHSNNLSFCSLVRSLSLCMCTYMWFISIDFMIQSLS